MASLRIFSYLAVLGLVSVCLLAASEAAEPGSFDDWMGKMTAKVNEGQAAPEESAVMGTMGDDSNSDGPSKLYIVVDKSGKGDFTKIQDAVDSIPKGNKKKVTIHIMNGHYSEKIDVPHDHVHFKCSGKKTILAWGDTAEKAGSTSLSASTTVKGDNFIATDCTFVNTAPAPPGGAVGKQAVAFLIQGDKAAFYRCFFYGAQDTLYSKEGRHYFLECYIIGSIDFIFGNGQAMFHRCKIKSIAFKNSGSISAQKRESSDSPTGFSFVGCHISGSGTIYLGRAWGTHSRTVFIRCYMADMILPIGWQDWNDPARQKTVFYGEYLCYGPGSNRSGRAKWSKELTKKEAEPFVDRRFVNGDKWLGW